MKKLFCRKNFFLLVSLFILGLFAYITYKTPLAGDDWGYALNGSLGTPVKTALEFYQSWSGRFFSELWGTIVPCHKWIWNIVNPILFVTIFACIYKLANVNKKYVLCSLLIVALMISVDDNLRMETYTWIMGTTYVIPLCFSLLYFVLIDKMISNSIDNKLKTLNYLSNVLLFIIGLMMENIAATMIVAIVVLIIYCYFNKKKLVKYLIINLVFSTISFTILRLSPGSASRLINDNATWNSLGLFEKISTAYPNFIQISFINNNYVIGLFSLLLIGTIVTNKNINKLYRIISILINILGIITVFYFVLGASFINDSSSIYSYIFWPLYVINAFVTLFVCFNGYDKEKLLFLLMVGGCSVLVMFYSPIYGSRSALYLVYYIIVVLAILLEQLKINTKALSAIIGIVLVLIVGDRTYEYIYKYTLVSIKQQERLEIIKYYQEHPEVEEAWIPRFPIITIHGADIEPDDTYHLETFKEYYGLPQESSKIVFYFEDEQ